MGWVGGVGGVGGCGGVCRLSVLGGPETQLRWAESYVALRAGDNSYQPSGLGGLAHRLGQLEFTFDFSVLETTLANDYG